MNQDPYVLELAPLPREQIGPFLLLGLDKDAEPEQIDAHWAQRVIGARKGKHTISLEDINWAREVINDTERRIFADVTSLNADTADGVLRSLVQRFGLGIPTSPTWQPLEPEQNLDGYSPAIDVPDPDVVQQAVELPEVPLEFPVVESLLRQFAPSTLDPWELFPEQPEAGNHE